jgi:hypothetical protein
VLTLKEQPRWARKHKATGLAAEVNGGARSILELVAGASLSRCARRLLAGVLALATSISVLSANRRYFRVALKYLKSGGG